MISMISNESQGPYQSVATGAAMGAATMGTGSAALLAAAD